MLSDLMFDIYFVQLPRLRSGNLSRIPQQPQQSGGAHQRVQGHFSVERKWAPSRGSRLCQQQQRQPNQVRVVADVPT